MENMIPKDVYGEIRFRIDLWKQVFSLSHSFS